jgi:hypothetical protein
VREEKSTDLGTLHPCLEAVQNKQPPNRGVFKDGYTTLVSIGRHIERCVSISQELSEVGGKRKDGQHGKGPHEVDF